MRLAVGISSDSLTQQHRGRPIDGIGTYTGSLLAQYQSMGINIREYVYPSTETAGGQFAMPAAFWRLGLNNIAGFSKPLELPVDVFHVTDYRGVPMTCPVVMTLHDAIPFVHPAYANSKWRSLKNFVLRKSAGCADHVIAISQFATGEIIEHYGIADNKISVIFNGVEEDWLKPIESEIIDVVLNKHKLHRGYFLTVGTLQPRKNLLRQLAAHDKLSKSQRRDHPLVVVGRPGWKCEDILVALQEKVAKGEAHWLRDVESREELKCLYAGAVAFLFPSLYEGFGLPVLEAFAVGVPVLTSNTTSLPEVSAGVGFEINPTNINQMAETMLHMLDFPDREARISAGRLRAAELSWRNCAKRTLSVYEKVLRGN